MKNNQSIRLFNHPILERLTHVHPMTPICIFSTIIIFFSYLGIQQSSVVSFILRFVCGFFLWTFIEYAIHRFVYHFEAKSTRGTAFIFLMHGIHHRTPRDTSRLVSPPVVSLFASTLILLCYRMIFGESFEGYFAGTMLGYLVYDLIHFAIHYFNWNMAVFKFLKKYHFSHHYLDGSKAFGVSSPLWDFVFKTTPRNF